MPKTSITQDADKLHIAIEQVGDRKDRVLEALQECAEGRCTCPTNQYEQLQTIEISAKGDGVEITLTPKPGEVIDRQAIDQCLDYTVGKAGGSSA